MESEPRTKEQRILRIMRKVLASVVKDVTPRSGEPCALSDSTIQDIRDCFGLIATRERELMEEQGVALKERPRYPDQESATKVVEITPLKRKDKSHGSGD
jgi:hypothetical protein